MSSRLILQDSQRRHPARAVASGAPDPDKIIRITLVLRRRNASSAPVQKHLSRHEFAQWKAADPLDVQAVLAFASAHQLQVVRVEQAARTITIAGRLGELAPLFDAKLRISEMNGGRYRTREGALSVPAELAGRVIAVLGFDDRPAARTYRRRRIDAKRPELSLSYSLLEIAQLYNFPQGTGNGQTIALIELGGGFRESDLRSYWHSLGLSDPVVTAVGIDGASNAPSGDPDSADGEVVLDIEVAGAAAPGAKIVCYFAPNTDQGFLNAINAAIHDTAHQPSIISISWGSAESEWTAQSKNVFHAAFADAAQLGITVCVASGDNGSSDGEPDGARHVDFPASSPWVLACGGTRLIAKNGEIFSETVWNDGTEGATGGGVSAFFSEPSYQAGLKIPKPTGTANENGRGVPDVAAVADPQTGYRVLVDGVESVEGGTSAVAPLWAALIARCNEQLGHNAGFLHPLLYRDAATHDPLHDITSGTNGTFRGLKGWDACTGLGSPDGAALLKLLKNT